VVPSRSPRPKRGKIVFEGYRSQNMKIWGLKRGVWRVIIRNKGVSLPKDTKISHFIKIATCQNLGMAKLANGKI
jgi:hypothetical protein